MEGVYKPGEIKRYKPITPGLRHKKRLVKPGKLVRAEYVKLIREGVLLGKANKRGGRNNEGRVTVRGRGGEQKRRVRAVATSFDRLYGKYGLYYKKGVINDRSRTANLNIYEGLIKDKFRGKKLVWLNVESQLGNKSQGSQSDYKTFEVGKDKEVARTEIVKGPYFSKIEPYLTKSKSSPFYNRLIKFLGKDNVSEQVGKESLMLKAFRPGQLVHRIGEKYVLAAGTSAKFLGVVMKSGGLKGGKSKQVATVLLPSGQIKEFDINTVAYLGEVGNENHSKEVIGNAGTNRRLGIRPIVRGTARNPIDHPHGGKTHGPGGRGKPAKNV